LIALGLTGFIFGFGSLSGLFGCPWMLDHLAMRLYGESLVYTVMSNGVGLFFAAVTALGINLLCDTLRYKIRENREPARSSATDLRAISAWEGVDPAPETLPETDAEPSGKGSLLPDESLCKDRF
jgi:hypothetical protein